MSRFKPGRETLYEIGLQASDIVRHIRRYWSVDGKPLAKPELGAWENADSAAKLAELLRAVERSRERFYPGPVIEWQLRNLFFEWDRLSPWRLTGSLHLPWVNIRHPEAQQMQKEIASLAWEGWDDSVRVFLDELVDSVQSVLDAIRNGDTPGTFDSGELDGVAQAVEALFRAIEFVPNELQTMILDALKGNAKTQLELMTELNIGSKETLNGKKGRGGMKELRELGRVANRRGLGFYRPDAPPD